AVLIDRFGKISGRYFKIHPVPNETKQFKVSRGSNIPVFKTDFGLIGIMICFDSYFPELPAILARKGARIIFFPHQQNTPDSGTYLLHLRAHAMFNCVYLVASTFGIKRGGHWDPKKNYPSYIIGPDGNLISCSRKEGLVTVTIDIERKWMVEGHGETGVKDMKYILAKYRRPELYRKEEPKSHD
ncbi:MAG: carbon-nitrogen hydrolase family protein, partial [Nitrospinae bacterium]|nr:carbon-nitrogen hydrolase family protein [Nitrospinota bacterium]